MTADVLTRLIAANLAAAAAVLLVLICRRPARRLIGPRLAYALWLIVPVAMLASFAPARTILLPAPAIASFQPAAQTAVKVKVEAGDSVRGPAPAARPVPPPVRQTDWGAWLADAWLAGAAVFLLLIGLVQRRTVSGFGLIACDNQGYARASNLKTSPSLIGLLRPTIVLPADFEARFAPCEQAMIIAHERTHLREGHLRTNALVMLVRALNWFNPLIHIGAACLRLDQELACDAAVVERFPGERRAYAQAMLKSQLARSFLPLGCSWPARSSPMLKERIEMLAIPKPDLVRRVAGAGALAVLCGGAGLAAWATEPPIVKLAQAPVSAQGAVAAALRPPAQPKVGVIAPTETPASENAAEAQAVSASAEALEAAITACDVQGALALGAGPQDVVRILTAGGPQNVIPNSAAWVRTAHGDVELGYLTTTSSNQAFASGLFPHYVPPGGLESLPLYEDVFPIRQLVSDRAVAQLMAGRSAQAVADVYVADNPQFANGGNATTRPDTAQAYFYQSADGTVGLYLPYFSHDKFTYAQSIALPGTSADPGPVGMYRLGQPTPVPQLPAWAAQLAEPTPYVPKPRPTRC